MGQRNRSDDSSGTLDAETSIIALSVEERVREFVGLVDLSHSHYYSNREVIARIAKFVARGELPPGASP